MGVSYNRNMSFTLDADLALLLDTELTSFSGSHLNRNAELTRSRLKLKRDVISIQNCIFYTTSSHLLYIKFY